jgi:hypothetical protein
MASITYQVTLSSDGKPVVSVTSDDPAAVRDAIPWLAQTYATLLKDAKAVPKVGTPTTVSLPTAETEEQPPICAVHQLPMVRVQGKRGPFWSCHERLPDGSWCRYKPRP